MRKYHIRYQLSAALMACVFLAGCGKTAELSGSESIELLDPVQASDNVEKAQYRHLYEYDTYMSVVYPDTETCAFAADVTFDHFAKFPGEYVEAGEVLAYADDTALAEQEEQIGDILKELRESYEDDLKELTDRIEEKQAQIDQKKEWAEIAKGEAESLAEEIEVLELELSGINNEYENRQQLYTLDSEYYTKQLEEIQKKGIQTTVVASKSGVVAALGEYQKGDWVAEDTPVVAIADESVKKIRCDYLAEEEIEEAARVYAVVNGEQFEVTYIPYEPEEYRSIVMSGKIAYSHYELKDPDNRVSYGALAVLVVVHEEEENALSVPVDCLHTDEGGSYVYVVKEGENIKTYVEEGFTDGVYTQIVQGIAENDQILLPAYSAYGSQTEVLRKAQFSENFDSGGYVVYPDYEVVTYDLTYGEGQFGQYDIERYDTVHKGDPVATITVQGDELLLEEKELRLQRLQERLTDLDEKARDPEAEYTAKQRESIYDQMTVLLQDIAELSDEIAKIRADYDTTRLYANADGIVIRISEKESGTPLSSSENLVYIASPDTCYLQISNTTQTLNYGDNMLIHYTDADGREAVAQAKVLTLTSDALSGEMRSEQAYLQLSEEVLSYLGRLDSQGGSYYEQLRVTGSPRTVENVLMIPKKAVFTQAGQTYVYVKQEDGTVTAQSFIAGGYDVEHYWVAEGLEEGMTICWE